MLAAGLGIRLWLVTKGGAASPYDIQTIAIVAHAFVNHPLHVYSTLRWLYPGGFLPVVLVCHWIASATGAHIWNLYKLPSVIADEAIAVTLVWGLGRLGASPRERIIAAGLVALSPLFIVVSGYQGQIDSVAILPALVAVIVWQLGGERRAWAAGLLVGVGAAIKVVPIFMVLAMLPSVRSRREAATLAACAVAVPLISVLPFLIANWHDTALSLRANQGYPGIGGLSVLVQPDLAHGWLSRHLAKGSGVTLFIWRRQTEIVGAAVLLAAAYVYRRRMAAPWAAALIWLVVYAANTNWAYNNLIWGIPFFLAVRRYREVAAFTALLVLPGAEMYFRFLVPTLQWLYIPLILLAWAAVVAAAAALTRTYAPARAEVFQAGEPRVI